jgi:hypothetical protein
VRKIILSEISVRCGLGRCGRHFRGVAWDKVKDVDATS